MGDRYHARVLRTPREVRNALVYVLFNHKKHGRVAAVDPCSSAAVFDGWAEETALAQARGSPRRGEPQRERALEATATPERWPVVRGETWLMRYGWKREGRLDPREGPAKS